MSRKSITQSHIKTVIISDTRGKHKKCQLCLKKFDIFLSEHQCKRCRRAVCQNCSPNKGYIINESGVSKKQHRICNNCKEESEYTRRFIEQQKINIGKDTFSIEWLKVSGITIEMAKNEYEQAQSDNNPNKDKGEFLKMKQELNQAMIEFWVNLNYSMREFFSVLIKENEQENMIQVVSRILGALLLQYPQIGYSSDQVAITLFLLCFSSESSTYSLLTIIYADIIPSNCYPLELRKNIYDYTIETDKVIQVMNQAFKIKQSELTLIRPFIRNKIPRYIQSFTFNFFLLQTTFYFINQIFLNPKNGYDNLLKCLATSYSIHFDDIKTYLNTMDEAEAQIMKGVKSTQCEKEYMQTKMVIFLNHNHDLTQSVIVAKQNDQQIKPNQNQIKIDYIQNEKAKKQINQEADMLEYSVIQDNEFQVLRRKTIDIKITPQQDEEKNNLKHYIEKIEESLLIKHKLISELQNRIKELQNQPPPAIQNEDANEQLIQANENLRNKISQKDLEIQQLEESKKFSDKIMEESQSIIINLQKQLQDLSNQLDTQQNLNNEFSNQIKELKQQLSAQGSQQIIDKNYSINISLNQKQSEEELQKKLDDEKQKIFQLEQQINQLNKEYLALQQLNQDKLRIIGNLEIKLIQFDTTKRENEKLTNEIVEQSKKIRNHELVIIQQQEHLEDSQQKYNNSQQALEKQILENQINKQEFEKKEIELLKILDDLRNQNNQLNQKTDILTDQLQSSGEANKQLQTLIIEKDQTIELQNKALIKGVKKFEELEIKHHQQIDDSQKQIQQQNNTINQLEEQLKKLKEENDSLKKESIIKDQQIQAQQTDFHNIKQLFIQLEERWKNLNNQHDILQNDYKQSIIELNNQKLNYENLINNHNNLQDQYKIIIIDLDSWKQKYQQLEQDHSILNTEKNNLENLIEELKRLLQEQEQKNQNLQQQHSIQFEKLEQTVNENFKKLKEMELLIVSYENTINELKIQCQKKEQEIQDYIAKISQLENQIEQYEIQQNEKEQRHQQILKQIAAHLERVNQLENHNTNLELQIIELQKQLQQYKVENDELKDNKIKLEDKIIILIADIELKQKEISNLSQIIEQQKSQLIDQEELIKQLKNKIVSLEKENGKLKVAVKQFKELSEEMAHIS